MSTTLHRHLLEPHPANRKHFDASRMAELHADIAARGVLDDLIVRPLPGRGSDGQPTHQILSGERRWRASEGTPAEAALPCKVVVCNDLEALELVAVPNIQREDLHPLDEATVFEQMLLEPPAWLKPTAPRLAGYSVDQLADRVHKKPAYVRARLRLLGLTPTARHAFLDDEFGIGSALQIARLNTQHQEEVVQALLHDAAKGAAWTADTISHTVQQRYMLRLAGAPFDLHDAGLLPEAGACATCPKRSGTNPELFDDIAEGDTCTDRACFRAKCDSHVTQVVDRARLAGHTVIAGREAEHLLPQPDGTVKGYLRLDRPSEFALSKKPLGEIIDRRDVALIVRSTDPEAAPVTVEVMPTAIVRQALKAKGLLREDADPKAEKRPARETKPHKGETPKPGAKPTKHETPPAQEVAIDDPILDELLRDFKVFQDFDTNGGAPSAATQRSRIKDAVAVAERLFAMHRIGAALRGDEAEGFPGEGLNRLLARLLSLTTSTKLFASCATLAGLDASQLTSGRTLNPAAIWALSEEQAARLAMVAIAADDGMWENEPKPHALVADVLGVATDDLQRRAKDFVDGRVRVELVAAAPKAAKRPPAKKAAKVAVKYRDPAGNTWSGRGLQPRWLREKLAAGAQLGDFAVGAGA